MIKVVLKIPESDINFILSKLVKLGIKNIKIKKNEKKLHLFRYKNTFENTNNEIDK
ncbi:hypothetical protein SAMN05444267_102075 [Chryseobacterium polytrichastri]|uniref:Uncharacterized protein n=1 Tax=Chryseobacterium polytrichastri TaxID=1302687 RepID=A0A1M7BSU0_9FLAO|nr:hypothetical protein SAMN05444267_102075 [Chryseobacterium polytrichastri]